MWPLRGLGVLRVPWVTDLMVACVWAAWRPQNSRPQQARRRCAQLWFIMGPIDVRPIGVQHHSNGVGGVYEKRPGVGGTLDIGGRLMPWLVDFDYEVVGEAPELGGVGDAEHFVSVYIVDGVGACGLFGEDIGLGGV